MVVINHNFRRTITHTCLDDEFVDDHTLLDINGAPCRALVFNNKDDADFIFNKLKNNQHLNIAKVYPPIKVAHDPDIFRLPYLVKGKNLEETIKKEKFVDRGIWITDYYRNLILAVFEVMKFTEIIKECYWEASLSNIYVEEFKDNPVFTFIGFKKKDEEDGPSRKKQFHTLAIEILEKINIQIGWQPPPKEMAGLCADLTHGRLAQIVHNPIFLERAERDALCMNYGDYLKSCSKVFSRQINQKIEDFFCGWNRKIVNEDKDLNDFRLECAKHNPFLIPPNVQTHFTLPSPRSTPVVSSSPIPPGLEQRADPYLCSSFIRQGVAHRTTTQVINSSKEFMYHIETVFPGVVMMFAEYGRLIEVSKGELAGSVLPRKDVIEYLFGSTR